MKKFLFLFVKLFFFQLFVLCQPCGPEVRLFDRQMIMPSGDILLVNTWLGGDLMMVGQSKSISFNYVLISRTGELKKDTTINLNWPDYYFDIMSCHPSYREKHPIDKNYYSDVAETGEACPTYMLYHLGKDALIGYFLKGDWKYAFDIQIDQQGNSAWNVYKLDSFQKFVTADDSLNGFMLEMPDLEDLNNYKDGFIDDNSKEIFWEQHLQKTYELLESVDLPHYTLDDFGNFVFKEFRRLHYFEVFILERIQSNDSNNSKESQRQNRWLVKGKRWQIPLDGYPIHLQNRLLVSMDKKRLYITVFNDDNESCRSYGHDVYPILYCINLRNGKVRWKYDFSK